jgi:hypothetical protein
MRAPDSQSAARWRLRLGETAPKTRDQASTLPPVRRALMERQSGRMKRVSALCARTDL